MRPTIDEYYLKLVDGVACRSTCARRQVGAIIVSADGLLLASGYNGVPRGIPHCLEVNCPGVNDPAGDTSNCLAVHAELNALLQAGDRLSFARTIYTSCLPCLRCALAICNTSIKRVVYREPYADTRAIELFKTCGVELVSAVQCTS